MKIREHKAETVALIERFESTIKSKDQHVDLLIMFDAIDQRLLIEMLWEQRGT